MVWINKGSCFNCGDVHPDLDEFEIGRLRFDGLRRPRPNGWSCESRLSRLRIPRDARSPRPHPMTASNERKDWWRRMSNNESKMPKLTLDEAVRVTKGAREADDHLAKENQHWNRDTALAQIDKCNFSCEAGSIESNTAWAWLRKALEIGPKYLPGQGVWYEVSAEVSGTKLSEWIHYYIVGMKMESNTRSRYWVYYLSNDPPAPYHYGVIMFSGVREDCLRLDTP